MNKSKTLVLGASTNPERYSYLAVHRLLEHGVSPIPFGIRKGEVAGVEIITEKKLVQTNQLGTVTIYLSPENQKEYYDFVISLKPNRVIFNPGTHNAEFMELLKENSIQVVEACTLVMLSSQTF